MNANGTLNLLEAARKFCRNAISLHFDEQVYGDAPNELPLQELELRGKSSRARIRAGHFRKQSIDQTKHSPSGITKSRPTCSCRNKAVIWDADRCFRGGCLTGPAHAGTELHGFSLSDERTVRADLSVLGTKETIAR